MSLENKSSPEAGGAIPQATRKPAPVLLIGAMVLLGFLGLIYVDAFGGGLSGIAYYPYADAQDVTNHQVVDEVQKQFNLGRQIFNANCSACHQASGMGLPGQFPPLAGSEWVNAKSPDRILRFVLCGVQGPITVEGKPFNNVMVPWRDNLKDDQIAAVVSFVRNNKEWGNGADGVTADEVKKIRDKVKDHGGAFTPDEVMKIPEGQ